MSKQDSVFRKVIDFTEATALMAHMRRRCSSGYPALDQLTGGLLRGGLTLVGARPAVGKTSLVLNVADRLCRQLTGTILVVRPWRDKQETLGKLLNIGMDLPLEQLLEEGSSLDKALENSKAFFESRKGKLRIWGQTKAEPEDLRQCCRGISDLQLVILEDLELSASVSRLLETLRTIAVERDIPVLCTSGVHRNLERRKNRRPRLQDLVRKGVDPDLVDEVLFLYRDRYYDPFGDEWAELIVAKHTDGTTGTVRLEWNSATGRFENWTK